MDEMRKTICNMNNSIEKTKILKKINSGLRNEDINESNKASVESLSNRKMDIGHERQQ